MSFDLDVNRLLSVPNINMSTSPGATNPTWQARYEELLQWRSERGDTCVPKAEGALGRWVARQRELKRSGKLDPGREQALNNIGFVWNTVTAMWEERYRRLTEWKRLHGHCAVPIAQGELGTWVSKQRQLFKRGKLSQEKIAALNGLGFTWSTAEADWEDKFKRLCQWAKERGHASVPFNEGELGWWVNTQRQCKRKGKLSVQREERLCSLGFVWNPSNSRNKNNSSHNALNNHNNINNHNVHTAINGHNGHSVSNARSQQRLFSRHPEHPLPLQQHVHVQQSAQSHLPPSASSADTSPGTTPEKYEDVLLPPDVSDPLSLLSSVDSKQMKATAYSSFHPQAAAAAAAAAASAAAHAQALASFGPHGQVALGLHPLASAGDDLSGDAYGFGNISGGMNGNMNVSGIHSSPGEVDTPPQPHTEGPFSPVPVSLSNGLWSPIELASPMVGNGLLNGNLPMYGNSGIGVGAGGLSLQLQPSVQQGVVPFSQAMSVQTHSDALEQLLSRTDTNTEPDAC